MTEEDDGLAGITGGDLVSVDPPVGSGVVLIIKLRVIARLPVPCGVEDQLYVGMGKSQIGPGYAFREVIEGEGVFALAVVVCEWDSVDA
jgi:hypothetical protein